MLRRALALVVIGAACALAPVAGAKVLRVGSLHGIRGQYGSLPAAVKAARPGDWILLGPGDYKTPPSSIQSPKGHPQFPAGVVITTRNLHIRGMDRNRVIIDGTRPGSTTCSRRRAAQNFGLHGASSGHGYAVAAVHGASGANGLMVYRAPDVSIENLTVCNFLGGSREAGNEIWWNGGAHSGTIGGHGYRGTYLSTTSTYLQGKSAAGEFSAARYGIFSSNWSGGTWDHIYASNFNDSGFYIGACQQVCDQTLDHGHAQYNALGYSGTNSGGRLLIENSEFDHNEDGLDTNSQNTDEPAPQNGACPAGVSPPIAGAQTCWVFYRNDVHDNNNANVPSSGAAAAGPVGTGMSVSGARNDTILDNRFVANNAWGLILAPYPDHGKPCHGGTYGGFLGSTSCLWDESGIAVIANQFANNGGYGNPSNGDIGQINLESGHPTDCYRANTGVGGGPLQPAGAAALQTTHPECDGSPLAASQTDPSFLTQVLCDSRVALVAGMSSCPAGTAYPRPTRIVMHPLATQPTMPQPCQGVPGNPWCRPRTG